jgi:hypothetical protein
MVRLDRGTFSNRTSFTGSSVGAEDWRGSDWRECVAELSRIRSKGDGASRRRARRTRAGRATLGGRPGAARRAGQNLPGNPIQHRVRHTFASDWLTRAPASRTSFFLFSRVDEGRPVLRDRMPPTINPVPYEHNW